MRASGGVADAEALAQAFEISIGLGSIAGLLAGAITGPAGKSWFDYLAMCTAVGAGFGAFFGLLLWVATPASTIAW